jgi:AcrR family transcriptional regulator
MRGGDETGPDSEAASDRASELRRATERSVLQLSGELGYERASVMAIVERSGSNLFRFYRSYAGKGECYAEAYAHATDQLVTRLRMACREGLDWIDGMRRALGEMATFVEEDRNLAVGIISEVHVAGGAALAKREEIIAHLSRDIDRARLETTRPVQHPPAVTSLFVVGAIESTVVRALTGEKPFREVLPGLLFIATSPYFGIDVARRAIRGISTGD